MRHRSLWKHLTMQRIGMITEGAPRLFVAVQRLRQFRAGFAGHIVQRGDAVVIDAFPRSGSSFALKAFRSSNPDLARSVGTHIRSPAHIAEALRLGVPAMVLIRDPDMAVPSLVALGMQTQTVVPRDAADLHLLLRQSLQRYIAFHRRLRPMAGRIGIVDFPDLVADFGAVMRRFNTVFATAFVPFDHTPESAAVLIAGSRRHLGPDPERDLLKARLGDAYRSPSLAALRGDAQSFYTELRARRMEMTDV